MKQKVDTGEVWDDKWRGIDLNKFYERSFVDDKWTLFHKSLIDGYLEELSSDAVFLEAGCGLGQWCFYASEKYNTRSIGVDVAEETINKLNEHNPQKERVSFVVDDLNNSSLESGLCDMFISLGVIEHSRDSVPMLKTLYRVTKPGGIGVITVPNLYSMHYITRPILQFIGKWNIGYEKSFSNKALKRIVTSVGFEVIDDGLLPTGELFGNTSINLPLLGRLFESLSFFLERRQKIFGFLAFVVVRKSRT